MPVFDYCAIDKQGKEIKGIIEADSIKSARSLLRQKLLIPIEVNVTTGTAKDIVQQKGRSRFDLGFFANADKLKVAELALITRQLATLLASGLPVDESLQAISDQTENDKIARIIKGVRSRLLEGHSLSASMGEFKQAFPELYRATINAGEHSGHLHMVLDSLAEYTEKEFYFRQKIKQASIYPSMMVTVSVCIVTFLLIYIVPKMVDVFQDSGHALPTLTTVLLSISNFLQNYIWLLIIGIFITIFVIKKYLAVEKNRFKFHLCLLRIPLISRIIKVSNTARYARTFGILSRAGVAVLDSMTTSKHVVTSMPIQEALEVAKNKVKEGVNISRALKETGYFPAMSIHLIASGENSGKLENMLDKAADYQEKEIEGLVNTFLSLFEPVMIIVLGFVVLLIVLAILLPIFQMNQLVGI